MSTRCYIGVEKPDKAVQFIYCHHDGYPAGVGKMLIENYDTPEKIDRLMALGDLSSLGPQPVDNPEGWSGTYYFGDAWKEDKSCISYRGRGDTDCNAREVKNILDYRDAVKGSDADFAYINKEGKWYLLSLNSSEEPELKGIYYRKKVEKDT